MQTAWAGSSEGCSLLGRNVAGHDVTGSNACMKKLVGCKEGEGRKKVQYVTLHYSPTFPLLVLFGLKQGDKPLRLGYFVAFSRMIQKISW